MFYLKMHSTHFIYLHNTERSVEFHWWYWQFQIEPSGGNVFIQRGGESQAVSVCIFNEAQSVHILPRPCFVTTVEVVRHSKNLQHAEIIITFS